MHCSLATIPSRVLKMLILLAIWRWRYLCKIFTIVSQTTRLSWRNACIVVLLSRHYFRLFLILYYHLYPVSEVFGLVDIAPAFAFKVILLRRRGSLKPSVERTVLFLIYNRGWFGPNSGSPLQRRHSFDLGDDGLIVYLFFPKLDQNKSSSFRTAQRKGWPWGGASPYPSSDGVIYNFEMEQDMSSVK